MRRKSWAFSATITVLTDISTAPIAGDKTSFQCATTPAAPRKWQLRCTRFLKPGSGSSYDYLPSIDREFVAVAGEHDVLLEIMA
jgi:hypothetical protein